MKNQILEPIAALSAASALFGTFFCIAATAFICGSCADSGAAAGDVKGDQAGTGIGGNTGGGQGANAGGAADGASGQTGENIAGRGSADAGMSRSGSGGGGFGGEQAATAGFSGNTGQAGAAGTDPVGGSGDNDAATAAGGSGGNDAAIDNHGISLNPFGCDFAWGTNDPGGSLASLDYLRFITKWIGYEVDSNGTIAQCDGCWWLSNEVSSTSLIPVFYAYFIGFFGQANGLPDGNQNPDGPNLTTHAAALIKSHRSQIIQMYASYAQQAYQIWPDRPLVWLLEGDFIQYMEDIQTDPLSMAELGQLAFDITDAIKHNMPNAVVAVNHTTWNSDEETNLFWQTMNNANVDYDMVWTSGVANNSGFIEASGNSGSYNAATATYAHVHSLTGRNIFVDTSFGISAMADTWTAADAVTLNARIAEGVIAANVVSIPGDYAARIATLAPLLDSTCD